MRSDVGNQGGSYIRVLQVVTPDPAERIRRHDSTNNNNRAHADVLQFGERERSNLTWPTKEFALQPPSAVPQGIAILTALLHTGGRRRCCNAKKRQLTRANPYRRRWRGYVLTLGCPGQIDRVVVYPSVQLVQKPGQTTQRCGTRNMNQLSVQRPVGNGFEPRRVMRSGVTLDMCTWGRGVNKLARFHLV
ncbi:hypothetical protein Bbelb_123030 [Branchiostoma belcheri]|nr:hypothetical protein Bbelb_123030 [Branchiostoma belcheri]